MSTALYSGEVMDTIHSSKDHVWKILLVDDDEDDYYITRSLLAESRGRKFSMDWVLDYDSAVDALLTGNYHAVLMDYDLGAATGIELIRHAVRANINAPIILLTGRGSYEVDMEAMQAGATLYLTKDEINPLLLERSIRYAVERKQVEDDLRRARDEMEVRVAERTEELRLANSALEQANEALEARVSERTKDLQAINKQLESTNTWLEDVNHELALANLRLQAVLHTAPAAVWIADASGRIMLKNIMADRIWGGEAPLSENIEEYAEYHGWWAETGGELGPDDWALARALQSGEVCMGQIIDILRFDGTHATILTSAAPIFEENGEIAGAVAVSQDISHQRRLEQESQEAAAIAERQAEELQIALDELDQIADELRHSREQLQFGVQAVRGGIWDLEVAPDSPPNQPLKVYLSPELKALAGYTDDELPNDLEKWRELFHPDDRYAIDRLVLKTLASGAQNYQIEYRLRHKEGRWCWIASQAHITRDKQGRPLRWTGIDWGIHERKEVELERERLLEENLRQRQFLEDLVHNSPVGIAFLEGPEHRYILANAAYRQLARGKGELTGRTVADVWAEIADLLIPILDEVLNTGKPITYYDQALSLEREQGLEEGYYTYSLTPMYGRDGEVRGISMLSSETTQQVLARRQIEAERDQLSDLLNRLQNKD